MKPARASVALLGLLLSFPAYAAASPEEVGIVTVEAEVQGADNECPADIEASCPFSWQPNPTSPGENDIGASIYVDNVTITVRPPLANVPREQIKIEPSDVVIHHPLNRDANNTWENLNDSRPEALRPYVAFESRPYRYFITGTSDDGPWGLFITVYLPGPIGPIDSISYGYCWNPCHLTENQIAQGSESEFRPFPRDVFVRNYDDTDAGMHEYGALKFYEVEHCLFLSAVPCDTSEVKPILDEVETAYNAMTPNVSISFVYNRTSVVVRSDHSNSESSARPEAEPGVTAHAASDQAPASASRNKAEKPLPVPPAGRDGQPKAALLPIATEPVSTVAAFGTVHAAQMDVLRAVLLASTAGAAILGFVLWLLYHRKPPQEALEQPTRRQIYDLICKHSGIQARSIAKRLGVGHTAVKYHLGRLERASLIRAEGSARKRYFPVGQSPLEVRRAVALFDPTLRTMYAELKARGEIEQSALGALAALSRSGACRASQRLVAAGLATKMRVGKHIVVRLAGAESGTPSNEFAVVSA